MPSDESENPWRAAGPWRSRGSWRSGGPRGAQRLLWLPVVISAIVQIISVLIAVHGGRPAVIVAAAVAFCASGFLSVVRRAPGPVVAMIAALCTPGMALVGGPPLAAAPLVFAVVFAVHQGARVWVWSSLGGIALVGGIGGYLLLDNPYVSVRVLIVVIALCLVVALSEAARARRARYRAVSRDVAARRQSAAEADDCDRRELHDVLAHSLSRSACRPAWGSTCSTLTHSAPGRAWRRSRRPAAVPSTRCEACSACSGRTASSRESS